VCDGANTLLYPRELPDPRGIQRSQGSAEIHPRSTRVLAVCQGVERAEGGPGPDEIDVVCGRRCKRSCETVLDDRGCEMVDFAWGDIREQRRISLPLCGWTLDVPLAYSRG
jgi:hypothetical protein